MKTDFIIRRIIKMVILTLLLSSCSNLTVVNDSNNGSEKKIDQISDTPAGNNKIIPKDVPTDHPENPSRITGSSNIPKYDGKSYYLYGAEHLKLKNYYFDFPVVYNAAVKKWIRYFLNRGRGFFERYSARAGRYAPILGAILEKHGLPRDLIFLAMAESGFQNNAKSWAKAVGPWQFMPYTGKRYGLKIDWYVDERRDPIKATIAAAKYLNVLYKRFGSWELAAAGYNAGEGKVHRAIKRYKTENFWKIRRGRYLKSETKNYVPKIMALAIIGKNLKAFGFEDISFHEPLDFDEVKIPGGIDLISFANQSGVNFSEIQRLNPELRRWFTPLTSKEYILRIPVGTMAKVGEICIDSSCNATKFKHYKTRGKSTTLKQIARKFRIKQLTVLTDINNISTHKHLSRGSTVLLPFRVGQSNRSPMYADLYEKPRKSVLRRRNYRKILKMARRRGRAAKNPTIFYTVSRGDSLWSVAKKNRISLANLIMSNYPLIKNRMIRAGDKLAIR